MNCVLGIRSQSDPNDIMREVFRAMKKLGYVSSVVVRPSIIFICNSFIYQSRPP